jgi:hypothetical protein
MDQDTPTREEGVYRVTLGQNPPGSAVSGGCAARIIPDNPTQ